MRMKLLDYYKLVLRKVSFEPRLVFKEYKKAEKVLSANEFDDLDEWIKQQKILLGS